MSLNNKHIDYNILVERFQNGNRKALEILIRNFHTDLKRIIQYHTRARQPVEDIAQECWHHIIQKLDELELKIGFDAWAYTIARRKAIDWIRRQQRLRKKNLNYRKEYASDIDSSNNGDENEKDKSKLNEIQDGIGNLPSTQKVVLNMFYMENLSLGEISQVLDIPEGTVKSRLYHARESLKKQLKT